jgi:hypothetical protein
MRPITRYLAAAAFVLVSGVFVPPAFAKENPVPPQLKNCPPPPKQYDSNGHPIPPPRDWYKNCLSGAGAATGATAGSSSTAQVVTDEKRNTVRVLIGGKEILTIDALGLHVNGNIEYAGKITNTGKSGTGENPTAP